MRIALPVLTLLLALAFAAAPVMTEPFSGFRSAQLPLGEPDPPIQPAGWAFAIWGAIYLWLVVSAVFGLLFREAEPDWDATREPLCLSLLLGVPWLAIANRSPAWATVAIVAMAVFAIAATLAAPPRDRWWIGYGVALYAGWLTAASAVAIGVTLSGFGIGPGPEGWAFAGVAIAVVVAWGVQVRRPDLPTYGLGVIWALAGIAAKNGVDAVGLTAVGAALVLLALLAARSWPELSRGAS